MGGVILVSEGVGCNFWPREGCKNEVPAMGTPLLPPPVPTCDQHQQYHINKSNVTP